MAQKRDLIRQFAHDREEEILIGRLLDLAERAQRGYAVYSKFLNPHERSLAANVLRQAGVYCQMHGGYAEAERAVAAFLPEYLQDVRQDTGFPVRLLKVDALGKGFGRALTHRDYLGSLMGLQIEREMVGDILVDEDGAQIFLLEQAVPVVLQELHKVGNQSVTVQVLPIDGLCIKEGEKQVLHVFVSSMRLDSIVAEGFGLSRTKAAEAVHAGLVYLQHVECTRPATEVQSGDIIALKGSGRITVGERGGTSRKGRTSLVLYRWK